MSTKELIKKTAKELGISEEKVQGVYDHIVRWTKYQVEKTDNVAIQHQYFGNIHAKKASTDNDLRAMLKRLEDEPDNEDLKETIEAYKGKEKRFNDYIALHNKPLTRTLHGRTDRRFFKKNLRDSTMDNLQIIQNEQYQKYLDQFEQDDE